MRNYGDLITAFHHSLVLSMVESPQLWITLDNLPSRVRTLLKEFMRPALEECRESDSKISGYQQLQGVMTHSQTGLRVCRFSRLLVSSITDGSGRKHCSRIGFAWSANCGSVLKALRMRMRLIYEFAHVIITLMCVLVCLRFWLLALALKRVIATKQQWIVQRV